VPFRPIALSILVTVVATAAACDRDPEKLKLAHIRSGDAYAARQAYSEAIIEYRRAALVAPRDGRARFKLAETYAAAGDVRNSLPEYVRAADLLPDDADLQLKAGNLLLLGGRFQDAKTRARVVLKQNPNDFRALVLLGNALAGLRVLDDAVDVAGRAVALQPERSGLLTNLGTLHLAQGERDLAEAAFTRAVSIAGNDTGPYVALANFYRSMGRLPDAQRALLQAHQIEPANLIVNRTLGSFLIEANRVDEAEPYFKAAAEIGKDPGARLALSDYYLAVKRYDEAAAVLHALAGDKNSFGAAKMRLALVELAWGRRADAYRSIEELLAKSPRDASAMAFKARLLIADFRIDEADEVIKTALSIDPRSAQVQFMLGKVRTAQNRLEDARRALNEAFNLEPFAVDAAMELARLHLQRREIDTSIGFAEKGVKNQPENIETRLTLVRSLMVRSEDYPRAEQEVAALLERFPAQAGVHTAWGNISLLTRRPAVARQAYERALQLDPDSVEAFEGLMALDAGANRLADTLTRLSARLADSPDNPGLLMLTARGWLLARDFGRAEQLLKRAIEADQGRLDAYITLGQLYISRGRLDDAIAEFAKLAALDSRSIPAATMLGVLYNAQKRPDEGLKWFERAAAIDPRAAAVASNNLAWMYAEGRGSLDLALQYARYATSQVPENAWFSDTLGWVYYKKQMIQQAIKAFEVSVTLEPGNAEFHYHLGLAGAANGDDARARRSLEQALKLTPQAAWAADARKTLETLVY
jgi:tetratricopeptide (TPR) repeat protein